MDLDGELAAARDRYRSRRPLSAKMADAAADVLPGGNTRSVLDFAPYPFRVAQAAGAYLEDVDGHRYLDLLGNYSAGLLGHDSAPVKAAVRTALDGGWSLGAVHDREAQFAELLVNRFPSLELVRFTNSGTEANLMAIATAKHVTARSKVLVCDGGYHGGVLYFGPTGRPLLVPHDWVRMTFNDVGSAEAAFARDGDQIACVLVEPMLGASGCIPARPEFLAALRALTEHHGAVLVFDEVMTSRVSPGGAQETLGITPDMTTLGKYLGGGLTFGAFGGRRELMQVYADGGLTHGGTFNNNVLTMAAGIAAVESLLTQEALADVNARGDRLRTALNGVFTGAGLPMCVTGWGSLMNIHSVAGPVTAVSDLGTADARLKELLFLDMLDEGYYFAARGYIALTMAIGDGELAGFVGAVSAWSARFGTWA
jgi:glutamate-1-semialdehyde 2,1-aminomutase